MKRHSIAAALALLCLAACAQASADEARRPYIVRLLDKPVASYTGGAGALRATQPAPGKMLDLRSADVQAYGAYLDGRRAQARSLVAAAPVQYEYRIVFNGFAALLTSAEVAQLKASGTVAAIVPDVRRHVLTSYTPTFLGLDQPGGLWSQLGGKEHAGENVIVGILDTGIWPEDPSYADRVDAKGVPVFEGGQPAYGAPPAKWKGQCQTGEGFTAAMCNNKLIGARYFNEAFLAFDGPLHWSEFRSARDSIAEPVGQGGHGTHTSTTAAGNGNVAATVNGVAMGGTSGIAPRARIAAYKVCWTAQRDDDPAGSNGCYGADSVAAIEQAVQDGVDVLSYSIGGGETPDDMVEMAFLNAANAGVFVAAAAGNGGPQPNLNHVGPWLATVAATTHDRQYLADLTLASGAKYSGASLNTDVLPATPLVLARNAGVAGADPAMLDACYGKADAGQALLDPDKVAGKIVVCVRGLTPRIAKSLAVKEAGGAGMVLVDDGNGPVAEVHSVPTVHVSMEDGARITAYAAQAEARGGISAFAAVKGRVAAPVVAAFSSRGPSVAEPSQLKPDLAAPGVEILAGVSPVLTQEQRDAVAGGTLVPPAAWTFMQGTSMATPHVAGLAALLRQRHPDWSPAAIKSALMTTATQTLPDKLQGDTAGIMPWAQGAGQVAPNAAADPGLVYDIAPADYLKYLCFLGLADECGNGTLSSADLNLPTITLANVTGTQTVKRSVTNVGATRATYTAKAAIEGYTVQVTPSTLTLAPGESGAFSVTLKRTTAAVPWQYGTLEWRDGAHVVRSALQARSPTPILTAPPQLQAERDSGMRLMSIAAGYTGKVLSTQSGLKEMERTALQVEQAPPGTADTLDQAKAACRTGAPGTTLVGVTVPAGTLAARFELLDRDVAGGDTGMQDLDLVLMKDTTLVDYSMHVGSNEAIVLGSPPAGDYRLCVIGYDLAGGAPTGAVLSSALVGAGQGANLKVALPSKVYGGSTATVGLSWSGLQQGKRYVGGVRLTDDTGANPVTTVLSVTTDGIAPANARALRAARKVGTL